MSGSRFFRVRWLCMVWALTALAADAARAGTFSAYQLQGSFPLPAGASGLEALPDGRLLTVVGDAVHVETAAGSRTFTSLGALPGADFSAFGIAFMRVSPDGTRVAIGNGGGASFANYRVGVFALSDLSGTWFHVNHFDAAWADDHTLALTGGTFGSPSFVSLLHTASADSENPVNPTVVAGIGGASGGIAFDAAGNLYTANGFATSGPSGTGAVKAFAPAAWVQAIDSGVPLHFETEGTPIVDLLSGGSLGFDSTGNMLLGGGDFLGLDHGFAALIHADAVAHALSSGGMVDVLDAAQVRRLDPDGGSEFNFYGITYNHAREELYVYDGGTVYVYAVPEPATVALFVIALGASTVHRTARRRLRGVAAGATA